MIRIAGIQLDNDKRIEAALTKITGIGRSLSGKILDQLNIDRDKKVNDMSPTEASRIREAVTKVPTEGELRRKVALDVKRLQEIGCYRGYRHRRKLPVRGQSTRYNARTRRGRKKMTVANKKQETK